MVRRFVLDLIANALIQVVLSGTGGVAVGLALEERGVNSILAGAIAVGVVLGLFRALDAVSAGRDQAFADALTEVYHEGVHEILNLPITDFNAWRIKESAWQRRVASLMEAHGCTKQELSLVSVLHEITVGSFEQDATKNMEKSMFSMRLTRVKRIIDTYSRRPIFTSVITRDRS